MMKTLKLFLCLISIIIPFNLFAQKSTSTLNSEIPLTKEALNTIVSHLKNTDSDIRAYAIESLAKTGNTKLINLIKKYLNDESKYVRIATVKALWKLGDLKNIEILKEIISDVPQKTLNEPDPLEELKIISKNKIREKAIEALVDLIGIKANKILLDLKENDNYSTIRDISSRELAKIGYTQELKNFYEALFSNDEDIRYKASESLVRICPYDPSQIIKAFRNEKSLRIKMKLLDAMICSKLSHSEEEYFIKLYSDSNQEIKYKIASILSNTSSKKTIEFLKKIYDDTPDIMIKLILLRKLYNEKLITLTSSDTEYFMSHESKEIKKKLIELYDIIKGSQKYLAKYLKDDDPYIQIDSAIAIIEKEGKK